MAATKGNKDDIEISWMYKKEDDIMRCFQCHSEVQEKDEYMECDCGTVKYKPFKYTGKEDGIFR